MLGIKLNTVNDHSRRINVADKTIIGITVSLVDDGKIDQALLTEGFQPNGLSRLTDFQRKTLDLISKREMWGATDKEVAVELGITESTLWGRLQQDIYPKLGVRNKFQAVMYKLYMSDNARKDHKNEFNSRVAQAKRNRQLIHNAISFPESRAQKSQRFVEIARQMWGIENIPIPPEELLEVLEKSRLIGFNYEPVYLPPIAFFPTSVFPGLGIAPQTSDLYKHRHATKPLDVLLKKDPVVEVQYWELIREGKISPDAATLDGEWVLIEGIERPKYDNGKQRYSKYRLAEDIGKWRRTGKIQIPEWNNGVPSESRFGISMDEIESVVIPRVASRLGVDVGQVRLPRAIEFNVIGNMIHPEWGAVDTWEWFSDKCDDGCQLIGGYRDFEHMGVFFGVVSKYAGLGELEVNEAYSRDDNIGFRTIINFPQQKAA